MNSFLKGKQAEERSLRFFLDQGYTCLAQRFKTRWGEIDLIVSRLENLHFVEVKNRPTLSRGLFSLLPKQQSRIYNTALSFLSLYPTPLPWTSFQFDLVIMTSEGKLEYMPHIFTLEGFEPLFL